MRNAAIDYDQTTQQHVNNRFLLANTETYFEGAKFGGQVLKLHLHGMHLRRLCERWYGEGYEQCQEHLIRRHVASSDQFLIDDSVAASDGPSELVPHPYSPTIILNRAH